MNRQDIIDWVRNEYGTEPEYLWEDTPEFSVLRNRSGKWYGLLMKISKRKFGIASDEMVEAINVKADTMLIDSLVNEPGFYRAYHMNKRYWISILLDGSVSDETIKGLIEESYLKTCIKIKKK